MESEIEADSVKLETVKSMMDTYRKYKDIFGDIHSVVKHPDIDNVF